MGTDLYNREYDTSVVIWVPPRSVVDTHVTSAETRSEFGDDVANIADATSFDETIDDDLDIYERCFEVGRGAVMVKAADILGNSDYYGLGGSAELRKTLRKKLDSFI
ncbi:hypothetical protein PNP59_07205 [Halobacterium salinarum]|nr:hypothetical protein [Halobacterium salinarum]MBB6090407.1 GTP pyrophosphokinase [Halobacterium salinarum]MDL0130727.1 hypothetical protein [Halobacterium salinarum]MDL0144494.1 hypothetical protein [Halobacterium salinarum]UEB92715.1 hypothetical protein LJ422_03450 [Halobacterium salinarum NRC-34001]